MNLHFMRMVRVALALAIGLFLFSPLLRAQSQAASLFKTKCASCHDADGSGSGPVGKKMGASDLRSPEVQKLTDAELTEVIKNGKGKNMPPYKDKLTDDQIKQLVAHIRDLAKKK
jgi:mono/diheme cytochrome c family protein